MKLTTKIHLPALLAAGFIIASAASARQVKLEVAMAEPLILAGKKNTTFLKVGLTGFDFTKDSEDRAPVNVAIVLDKSGSMDGEKIIKAREAAKMAIQRLNENDIVSVILYDSTVRVIVPATKVSDKEAICAQIDRINANGSTALFAGVSKGAAEIRKFINKERVNRVLLLSDGQANIGPKSPGALGELGGSLIKDGISVSTIGLGSGYNEDLMFKLADRSDGNHAFAENGVDLVRIFDAEFGEILSVVAQEVLVKIECSDGVRPVRVIGRDAEISGATATAGTDPTNADTDGDGLQDGAEIATHNTDPNVADSDGDGFGDGDEVVSGTNPNNSNSFPSLAVPLAYWPFDDQDPVTTEDITGKHPGALNGNPTYVAGHSGEADDFALQFDGVDDFVASGAQLLNLKDGFTMSGWVNFTVSQGNRTGLFGQNDLAEFGMINATTMQLWTPRAGAVNVNFGPSSEGWRHIAVTGDNLSQTVYIDGQVAGAGGGPAPLANSGFNFNIGGGGVYDAANNWFNGQIDDVAVWDVVMTAETIAALADGTLTPLGAKDETPLEITSVAYNPTANEITLTWKSKPNLYYAVDQSSDLSNWDLEIDDSVQSTGETTSFTFPPINATEKAFFRVRVSE